MGAARTIQPGRAAAPPGDQIIHVGSNRWPATTGKGTPMGLMDNIKGKAAEALANEGQTDAALDKAAELAKERTGGQHNDKIDQAREQADQRLGGE
ncbi:MAG: antitoxin [Dermatophilaceae bacterium]